MSETGLLKSYSNRTISASFKADPELWSRFKEGCRIRFLEQGKRQGLFLVSPGLGPYPLEDRLKRGVSVCHVLEALMEAWIQGQRAEATVIKPVVINLTMEHVVQRPRRLKLASAPWDVARDQRWPPGCEHADKFLQGPKEVGCLDLQEWVPLEKCWRCYLAKRG